MIVTVTTPKEKEYPPLSVDTPMSLRKFVKMHVDIEIEEQLVRKRCVDGFVIAVVVGVVSADRDGMQYRVMEFSK